MCGMSIASVKQSLMNGVAVVHRISCTAIEPRHGRGGTARHGLGRTSAFPLYISVAYFSWKVYNDTTGMQLAALLPCPVVDADWPEPGWKQKSDGFRETKRYFMSWCLSIVFESARQASFTRFTFQDPSGVKRKAVSLYLCHLQRPRRSVRYLLRTLFCLRFVPRVKGRPAFLEKGCRRRLSQTEGG
jgi:hypothetical protein